MCTINFKTYKIPFCQMFFLAFWTFMAIGCDSPSSVGIDTLAGVANPPQRTAINITPALSEKAHKDITGNVAPVLVGNVSEVAPLSGVKYEAVGSMDFVVNISVPTKFKDGPITSAELRLARNYLYGAKNTPFDLAIYDMPTEWSGASTKYDTTFTAGNLVTTFRVENPADTSALVIPLPSSWLTANKDKLISSDFETLFHGFQFKATNGNSILGFDPTATKSYFKIISNGEEVRYVISSTQRHSHIKRSGKNTPTVGKTLLQDNTGDGLAVSMDVSSLKTSAISSGILRVHIDTLSTFSTNDFARPTPKVLALYGVNSKGEQTKFVAAGLDKNGYFDFTSASLTLELQRVIFGKSDFTKFFIAPNTGGSSLDAFWLHDEKAVADKRPQIIFTFVNN